MASGRFVRDQRALQPRDAVLQPQLALFQALDGHLVGLRIVDEACDGVVVFLSGFLDSGGGGGVSGSIAGVSVHVDSLFVWLSAFNIIVLFHFNFLFVENKNRKQ